MPHIKLFDRELKIRDIIWEKEPITAKELSLIAGETIGWNKNTTYTILKKLIDKKAILRIDPDFVCTSQIKKNEVQKDETFALIEKLYKGSKKAFFAAFLKNESLTEEELMQLKEMIEKR